MLLCAFGRRPLRAGFLGSAASFAGFSCTSFSFTCFSFAVFSFTGFSSAGAASFFALVLLVIGFLAGFAGFSSAGFSSSFSSAAKASFSVFFFDDKRLSGADPDFQHRAYRRRYSDTMSVQIPGSCLCA